MGIPFVKGHGTGNDFILLPDLDASLDLTAARVRALCDRRAGLGADGVLKVVSGKAIEQRPDQWFMVYWNADGSAAQLCGNAIRVFARYLRTAGLTTEDMFIINAWAGGRSVGFRPNGDINVQMGSHQIVGESAVIINDRAIHGIAVDVGVLDPETRRSPHLVCEVDRLDDLDLSTPPAYDPEHFPKGVNVEFVVVETLDRLRMRVHERGVGETRSCGTGAVAAAVGVLRRRGDTFGDVDVLMPGGQLHVKVGPHFNTLEGPAVLGASGEIDRAWWDSIKEIDPVDPVAESRDV